MDDRLLDSQDDVWGFDPSEITATVTCWFDARDRIVNREHAEQQAALLPDTTAAGCDGCGHVVPDVPQQALSAQRGSRRERQVEAIRSLASTGGTADCGSGRSRQRVADPAAVGLALPHGDLPPDGARRVDELLGQRGVGIEVVDAVGQAEV